MYTDLYGDASAMEMDRRAGAVVCVQRRVAACGTAYCAVRVAVAAAAAVDMGRYTRHDKVESSAESEDVVMDFLFVSEVRWRKRKKGKWRETSVNR